MINHDWYVYLWIDPANNIPRYVGKGRKGRAFDHIEAESPYRYAWMLKKRHREGYVCLPRIVWVNGAVEAKELEIFLIAWIGREDKGLGSLWNKTDGGEGTIGLSRKMIDARNRAIGNTQRNIPKTPQHIAALKQGQRKRTARSAAFIGVSLDEWYAMPRNERVRRRRKIAKTIPRILLAEWGRFLV